MMGIFFGKSNPALKLENRLSSAGILLVVVLMLSACGGGSIDPSISDPKLAPAIKSSVSDILIAPELSQTSSGLEKNWLETVKIYQYNRAFESIFVDHLSCVSILQLDDGDTFLFNK